MGSGEARRGGREMVSVRGSRQVGLRDDGVADKCCTGSGAPPSKRAAVICVASSGTRDVDARTTCAFAFAAFKRQRSSRTILIQCGGGRRTDLRPSVWQRGEAIRCLRRHLGKTWRPAVGSLARHVRQILPINTGRGEGRRATTLLIYLRGCPRFLRFQINSQSIQERKKTTEKCDT